MLRTSRVLRTVFFVAGLVVASAAIVRAAAPAAALPYRFLLVINDQWRDPASEVIQERNEFSILCALLRSWGLPYEIYRLDQQRFDAYHLVDREGRPWYGTILWNAPRAPLDREAGEVLRWLVQQQGVGLVAFSDAIADPALAELVGVKPLGTYATATAPAAAGEHFITRGVEFTPPVVSPTKLLRSPWTAAAQTPISGIDVELRGAAAIATREAHPLLTARQLPGGGRAVWLDAERGTGQLFRQALRDVLKRALVWVNGYALYAEYPRSVVLSMDDMGSSDKTYYSVWHYPSLSAETIRTSLIEPLQRHHAMLGQNVNTGWLDRKTRRMLNPWRQTQVVDELDPRVVHDFASTKRGLEAGVKAGVFEIQSHGWTHMVPDLDSPPGPFWSAPANGEVIQLNWYKEFSDVVRNREIPASVQRLHIRRSLADLEEDFGVRPIMLRCGGGGVSNSAANNTMRLAAQMGFGLAHGERHYFLDSTLCLPLDPVSPELAWNHTARLRAAEVPWTLDAPCWIGTHDRDVAMDRGSFAQLLDDLGPGVRYLSYSEYCAYLHTRVERGPAGDGTVAFRLHYDERYCDYFRTHASAWTLHLSDETRATLGRTVPERQVMRMAAGLGPHTVRP